MLAMSKKVVIINAGPRKNMNTDTLLQYAKEGVLESNNEVIYYDLYRLEKYTGCISCFSCKKEKLKGSCIVKDGLHQVLQDIKTADGLIIGTPNYFGDVTSAFRALYERLVFPYLTYNAAKPNCNDKRIKVLLLMTSNAQEGYYASLMENYQRVFERFIGDTKVYLCGNTKQVKDYSKLDWEWTYFDIPEKERRHDEVFPKQCLEVKELGRTLLEE